jgi:hypothetical protein
LLTRRVVLLADLVDLPLQTVDLIDGAGAAPAPEAPV